MTKWARIDNDAVVETVEFDPTGLFHDSFIWVECNDSVTTDFIYSNGKFQKRTPVENALIYECTPAQGLVALFVLKQITEDDVQAAIDSIEDPVQKYTAQIAFKRAVTWERNSQTMQTMAQLLALSEKDLDELFEYAVTIQA